MKYYLVSKLTLFGRVKVIRRIKAKNIREAVMAADILGLRYNQIREVGDV